jgi:hypothetical protein
MKTKKFYIVIFCLGILVSPVMNAQKKSNELPGEVSSDWYKMATENILKKEYDFSKTSNPYTYRTVNQKNHLGFIVSPDGFSVYNLKNSSKQQSWKVDFTVAGTGRVGTQCSLPASFTISENSSTIIFSSKSLDVEYVNKEKGLRQNFIVKEKPAGEGKLRVQLNWNSSLEALESSFDKLVFYSKGNKNDIKLIYDDLKVWDANGTLLQAELKLDEKDNSVNILVDDAEAAYPITIDPLNRTAEWSTSADGILPALLTNLQLQVETLYGYTVAGLGDINGDGFDDVAISAPGMADLITGSGSLAGVGAVFIYLGSPSGLPTNPSKVLQPTTAVEGALFGFSVDAGDITGDGKNDIIIGAPMDRYQTSAQGLLGSTTVNVTAGKVYLYRSEDLFSAPNPTPFLEIRLQGNNFFSTGVAGLLLNNVNVNFLFGFSVSVTKDLNGDNKSDIVIGSPTYLGKQPLSVQGGAAFVYYSNNLSTTLPVQLETPSPALLGLPLLPLANTTGLLFGFSVDCAGDYNNDFYPDLVVGAPAGVDLSSLGGIFTGQFLGGSAYVYYGTGSGVTSSIGVRLQADPSGLLSNAANLFGYDVKGTRNANDQHNGGILIGAPAGSVISNVVGGLRIKAGQVHVFMKKSFSPASPIISDQIISSPRSSSILSILTGQTINVSLMYGASIDNMLDVNCDGYGDIIVGEPLSTAVPLIGANVVGGSAYIYLGNPDGSFATSPHWDLTTEVSPLLGVNTTALVGYSVAGAKHVYGTSYGVRSLVGAPSNALDFGVGLLNLGHTLGTTLDFVFDGNGLGKSYSYPFSNCNFTLPVELIEFSGKAVNKTTALKWTSEAEVNLNVYELQKSKDGVNFSAIAIAFAKGNQRNNYEYADMHPFDGTNFYRLKMIDIDGTYTYSKVVIINFGDIKASYVTVAPNPAKTNINLQMTALEQGAYTVEITNSIGQVQLAKKINVTQYNQKETIPCTAGMNNGIYYLSIYDVKNNRIKSIPVFISNN